MKYNDITIANNNNSNNLISNTGVCSDDSYEDSKLFSAEERYILRTSRELRMKSSSTTVTKDKIKLQLLEVTRLFRIIRKIESYSDRRLFGTSLKTRNRVDNNNNGMQNGVNQSRYKKDISLNSNNFIIVERDDSTSGVSMPSNVHSIVPSASSFMPGITSAINSYQNPDYAMTMASAGISNSNVNMSNSNGGMNALYANYNQSDGRNNRNDNTNNNNTVNYNPYDNNEI